MKWRSFHHGGKEYPLNHVHPFEWTYSYDNVDYEFHIEFSHHVFTAFPESGQLIDEFSYQVPQGKDHRHFDFDRYELSKGLTQIIQTLDQRQCFHTSHSNFLTVDIQGADGNIREYEVFFRVSKTGRPGWLRLFVESAYIRDEGSVSRRSRRRKIGLNVIARNTLSGNAIKKPPR